VKYKADVEVKGISGVVFAVYADRVAEYLFAEKRSEIKKKDIAVLLRCKSALQNPKMSIFTNNSVLVVAN
jgi:hypothetical protein